MKNLNRNSEKNFNVYASFHEHAAFNVVINESYWQLEFPSNYLIRSRFELCYSYE